MTDVAWKDDEWYELSHGELMERDDYQEVLP